MQHVTSFTMFDSYHVALFTLQTRDFGKIQDGPQCVKWFWFSGSGLYSGELTLEHSTEVIN